MGRQRSPTFRIAGLALKAPELLPRTVGEGLQSISEQSVWSQDEEGRYRARRKEQGGEKARLRGQTRGLELNSDNDQRGGVKGDIGT